MGRRKKVNEEPIVEQINEQVIEEDTAKQAESEIEFLIKILNRQFELVGVPYTTEELIEMDQETQAKALNGYKLTDDLYNEWYNYFIEMTKDNFLFNGLNESDLQNMRFVRARRHLISISKNISNLAASSNPFLFLYDNMASV